MDAKAFLKSLVSEAERAVFAERCGTSLGHMRNCLNGLRSLAPEVCVAFERATCGEVTRRDLRPDDWGDIWPELVSEAHPWPAKVAA